MIRPSLVLSLLMCAGFSYAQEASYAAGPEAAIRTGLKSYYSSGSFKTSLVSLTQGTLQSSRARSLSMGGYELSGGKNVLMEKWYTSSWKDTNITFMTQLSEEFGVLWGFNTGEKGEKYRIAPGLTLGFISRHQLTKSLTVTLRASTVIGSRLTEKPCVADYGELGGVHKVNCRLAAEPIAPEDTLAYLVNKKPNEDSISVKLEWIF